MAYQIQRVYRGMDMDSLIAMRADALANRAAIHKALQSYAIAGRNFNRAPLERVMEDILELNYEIQLLGGAIVSVTYPDVSC